MKQEPSDLERSLSAVGEGGIVHMPAGKIPHIIAGDYPGMKIILEYNGERFAFTGFHVLYLAYQLEKEP